MADQVDRSVLPLRRPVFKGSVNRTLAGSRPDWNILSSPSAPEGAPNVLLVLVDDAGFGQPSTFGGEVATPAMSRLADDRLRWDPQSGAPENDNQPAHPKPWGVVSDA